MGFFQGMRCDTHLSTLTCRTGWIIVSGSWRKGGSYDVGPPWILQPLTFKSYPHLLAVNPVYLGLAAKGLTWKGALVSPVPRRQSLATKHHSCGYLGATDLSMHTTTSTRVKAPAPHSVNSQSRRITAPMTIGTQSPSGEGASPTRPKATTPKTDLRKSFRIAT